MIKSIVEEIVLVVLLIVAAYLIYQKWLKGWIASGATAAKELAAKEAASVKTIVSATVNPAETMEDFWKSISTEYISQEQYRANIARIQAELDGRKS